MVRVADLLAICAKYMGLEPAVRGKDVVFAIISIPTPVVSWAVEGATQFQESMGMESAT